MRAMIVVPRTGAGTNNDPYRCPLTCSWSDRTGQPVEDIITGKMAYTVEVNCDSATLTSLKAQYPVIWQAEDEGEPTADLASLKTALGNVYSADVVDYVTNGKTDPQEIAELLKECQKRPPWKTGINVALNDVYAHGNNLYRCCQAHKTQADWTPDKTPALWVRFHEVEEGPQPWVQPTGAHDAYNKGDRVLYNGKVYESLIDANVWSPSAYPQGWKEIK